MRDALRDRRFAGSVLLGNFALLPLLAWALVEVFDFDPVVRIGVLLVLLVPCTDCFITFSQWGKGDMPRAIALTPLNLVLQWRAEPGIMRLGHACSCRVDRRGASGSSGAGRALDRRASQGRWF